MSKAFSLLTLCVVLTLAAAGCSVEPEVVINDNVVVRSTQGADDSASSSASGDTSSSSAGGGTSQSEDRAASESESNAGDGAALAASGEQSCNYLGTDSWGDMQIEAVFTSGFGDVADTTVRYSMIDASGVAVHDSSATVAQVAPGENLRWHIDTLYEPTDSDTGYTCRIDALTPSRADSNLVPPSGSDGCRFVELDNWADIQIELQFSSPFDTETYVSYALRSGDGVRFGSGYVSAEAVTAGTLVVLEEDTITDVPEWLNESDITCEILGITEF